MAAGMLALPSPSHTSQPSAVDASLAESASTSEQVIAYFRKDGPPKIGTEVQRIPPWILFGAILLQEAQRSELHDATRNLFRAPSVALPPITLQSLPAPAGSSRTHIVRGVRLPRFNKCDRISGPLAVSFIGMVHIATARAAQIRYATEVFLINESKVLHMLLYCADCAAGTRG
ncbi:hypothetical protein HNQ99_002907 [Rhizorhapis suberifaciens]|uniref:Uncharacterized protein n=1 Tax=Rhizorhapis suberifaciens TaxID=13656 RepID=A0A840HY45_9SPHN|nr:hypothetical protein [Rhizorhapis suberifaciens]